MSEHFSYLWDWFGFAIVASLLVVLLIVGPEYLGKFMDYISPMEEKEVDPEYVVSKRLSEQEREKGRRHDGESSFYESNF